MLALLLWMKTMYCSVCALNYFVFVSLKNKLLCERELWPFREDKLHAGRN